MITYSLLVRISRDVAKGLDEKQIEAAYSAENISLRDIDLALYALKNPPVPLSFNPNALVLKSSPAIYESVASPGKKIKVLTPIAWSFAFDKLAAFKDGIHLRYSGTESRSIMKNYLLEIGYKEVDIGEALDIFERDAPNREVSNEAVEINRYFNDAFYGISKDNKFIRYVFLGILLIAVFLALFFLMK